MRAGKGALRILPTLFAGRTFAVAFKVKERIRRGKEEKVYLTIFFVIFVLYSFSLIFPFLWMALNSLKDNAEFFQDVWSLPKNWLFSNYVKVMQVKIGGTSFAGLIGNSILYVSISTVISMIVPTLTAYIIAKYDFKGRSALYAIAVFVLVVPTIGGVSAMYKLLKALGLYNSYFALFLMCSGGFGFNFLLLYAFFKNLSWSYAEAAFVDGAGDWRVFFQIMLPQARATVFSLAILTVIAQWNDYFSIYMYAPSRPTLPVGIKTYLDTLKQNANYPQLFAIMIVSILPILILFACFQDMILKSTVAGGLKG